MLLKAIEDNLTSSEMATKFNVSRPCISQALGREKLTPKVKSIKGGSGTSPWEAERENILKMMADRWTNARMARHYGITHGMMSGIRYRLFSPKYAAIHPKLDKVVRKPREFAPGTKTSQPGPIGRWTEAALTETWEARKARRARGKGREG